MECPKADRVALTRLVLESESERLAAERQAFEKLKARMNLEESQHGSLPPKRIRRILEEAAPNFIPLEFDENGNSRPANIHLEEEAEEEKKAQENPPKPKMHEEEDDAKGLAAVASVSSPKPSLKCGAWPEWTEDEPEAMDVGEEEEEVVVDFQTAPSPEMDIANVVVEDEVNCFDGPEPRSPLNALPTVRRAFLTILNVKLLFIINFFCFSFF